MIPDIIKRPAIDWAVQYGEVVGIWGRRAIASTPVYERGGRVFTWGPAKEPEGEALGPDDNLVPEWRCVGLVYPVLETR